MPLIYITGISGSGKTTLRNELRRRGYQAFGTDEDQLAFYYDNQTGKPLKQSVPAAIRTPEWRLKHTWKVARADVEKLQEKAKDEPVFLCGVVANDVTELWDLFETVIALTIDEETMRHRIMTWT